MKINLKGNKHTKDVWLNGKPLDIKKSQKVRNHSEQFYWGYGGSGPAQLALAICLEVFGIATGYQDFKWKYIATLPMDDDIDLDLEIEDIFQKPTGMAALDLMNNDDLDYLKNY